MTTSEILEITSADQQTCERPLYVHLSTNGECAESHISTGSGLRFDVVPKIGRVYVDGILWGEVWELSIPYGPPDGIWRLPAGPHHIVVQSPGYDRLVVDVLIKEYEVTTYSGFLTETIDAGSRGAPTFAPR